MADAEPSKSDEPAEAASATDCRPRPGAGKLRSLRSLRSIRILRALLAPVLVAGAVGVHFAVNVPEEQVVMPKRKDEKPTRPRRAPQAPIAERSEAQMDTDWERWKSEPYEGEPIRGKWGRRMQTTVNKAVVLARKDAFEGAPEDPRVVVSGTQCRTVRCRFILRSPFEHELVLVVEALKRQIYEDQPLWRLVESEVTKPPTQHSTKTDHYVEVTLGVRFDAIETREIAFTPRKGNPVVDASGKTENKPPVGPPAQ